VPSNYSNTAGECVAKTGARKPKLQVTAIRQVPKKAVKKPINPSRPIPPAVTCIEPGKAEQHQQPSKRVQNCAASSCGSLTTIVVAVSRLGCSKVATGRDQESSEAVHLARVFLREWWPSGLNVNLLSSGLFFGDDNHGQLRN
jgi:hypothetical protein